jgi:hypothetical protein
VPLLLEAGAGAVAAPYEDDAIYMLGLTASVLDGRLRLPLLLRLFSGPERGAARRKALWAACHRRRGERVPTGQRHGS